MKGFIKECLFFQTEDKQTKVIGVTAWVLILLSGYMYYELTNLMY